jgi:hypothetical protein
MTIRLLYTAALAALASLETGSDVSGAFAAPPTAEVAKKCGSLTAQAFPPRTVGNPAAGTTRGTGQDEQSFFRKCLENGGNIEVPAPKELLPLPPERPH